MQTHGMIYGGKNANDDDETVLRYSLFSTNNTLKWKRNALQLYV